MFGFAVSLLLSPSPIATSAASTSSRESPEHPRPLRRHLERELPPQTRGLDHGTLSVSVHGGTPHVGRLDVGLGLLDHLSGGVTAHWWPRQPAPRWAPWATLTMGRTRRFAVSVGYDQVLHPPRAPGDALTFEPRTHNVLGALELFQAPFAVGVEAGISHTRQARIGGEADAYRGVVLPAGGIALRVGGRRWGVTVRGRMPVATAELGVDVRFGLFEFRRRGGW